MCDSDKDGGTSPYSKAFEDVETSSSCNNADTLFRLACIAVNGHAHHDFTADGGRCVFAADLGGCGFSQLLWDAVASIHAIELYLRYQMVLLAELRGEQPLSHNSSRANGYAGRSDSVLPTRITSPGEDLNSVALLKSSHPLALFGINRVGSPFYDMGSEGSRGTLVPSYLSLTIGAALVLDLAILSFACITPSA